MNTKKHKHPVQHISALKVAEVTGINYQTVLRHIKKGILPGVKWRGKYAVAREDMRKWAWMQWESGKEMYPPMNVLAGIPRREKYFIDHVFPPEMDDATDAANWARAIEQGSPYKTDGRGEAK